MRGAKVVFCRERNKYVQNTSFWGLISGYSIFKIKNGIVQIAESRKKVKLFKLPVLKSYAMRGAKVVFCRERNKYVKIKKIVGIYQCIYT